MPLQGRPPSPGFAELAAVAEDIKRVEAKIEEVEAEIKQLRSDKPDGWREDVAMFSVKEQQLRKKEEQLREEKLELMRTYRKEG